MNKLSTAHNPYEVFGKQLYAIRWLKRVHQLCAPMVGFHKTTCENGVLIVLLSFGKHWFDSHSVVARIGVRGSVKIIGEI
jgi:hypothetical protein